MSGRAAGVAWSSRERRGSVALVVSSLVVVAVAAGFDVLAGARPDHTLSLVLTAAAVGAVRWLLRGRLRGFFSLVNLAVVAQPAAHGVGELTRFTASQLPHSHLVPEALPGLAVQVAVALLVAVVAGSEPLAVFVVSTVVAAGVALARHPVPENNPAWGVRLARTEHDAAPVDAQDAVRCRPRRGPPRTLPAHAI